MSLRYRCFYIKQYTCVYCKNAHYCPCVRKLSQKADEQLQEVNLIRTLKVVEDLDIQSYGNITLVIVTGTAKLKINILDH